MSQRVHISLPVTNLEHSIRFYESVLGQPASKRKDGYANFRLDEPPIHLALVQGDADPASARRHHFGIEVPDQDQLGAWRARATGADLPVKLEEGQTCCYAVADKFWVTDPDGHEWEVWVRLADADSMYEPTSTCCA
jgi:catechol 2,3-dioxygenase-like lactoylglutathione lyase family enzyme